jgi:acyl-coenzyme A thioesterase PaaI-like protein
MNEGGEAPLSVGADDWCFVCGRENPIGLKTVWTLDEGGAARARFSPGREHQGWRGIVHGGILAALLDEAMAQRLRLEGIHAVTAGLDIRYRKPAPTGAPILIEGRLVSERSRSLRLAAWARGEDGQCFAEAEGLCIPVEPRRSPDARRDRPEETAGR